MWAMLPNCPHVTVKYITYYTSIQEYDLVSELTLVDLWMSPGRPGQASNRSKLKMNLRSP